MISLRNSIKSHKKVELYKVFSQYRDFLQDFQQLPIINVINEEANLKKIGKKCSSKITSTLSSIGRDKLSQYQSIKNVKYCFSQTKYQFSQTKEQKINQTVHSSHLSTILSEPKEHQFILHLFTSFQKQSQILNSNFQSNSNFMDSQQFTKILTSLNTLSQNINLFLLELQIQQMSEIDRWKWSGQAWSGKLKQHRQNILIQIEQRKLFYKRLQNFLSNVTKQLQGLFHSEIVRQQSLKIKKQSLQVKNNSKLVQGDFFKHSFLTENYQEIYEEVKESKEDYLLKSRKLKSFSLLKVNDYESNYALKLRLMIQILSQIKHIYQIFLINQAKKLNLREINYNFTSVNNFLSQTVISPDQYEELIRAYSNQFSQENIKNFMFMSVGYHSPEISQLNKELVDVKIKETIFDFDIQTLCNIYLVKQNQWLYNLQGCDYQPTMMLNDTQNDQKMVEYQNQQQMKKYSKFQNNKQIILKYAKVILKELHKLKKEQSNHQIQFQKNFLLNQNTTSDQIGQSESYSQQKISFNQLLPYNFFNITDVIRIQSLIQQEIIPLMVNPYSAYQTLVLRKLTKLKQSIDQKTKTLINQEYLQNLNKLLNDIDSNMYFISRFYEWSIHMIVHIKNFLNLFYQTQKQNIQKELSLLLHDESNPQQIHTPHLIMFFRMINVLYNANNRINPIYIEDFISTTEDMTQKFTSMIKLNICQKMSLSPAQLLKIFDKVLLKLIRDNKERQDGIPASLFRFRVFSAFLDNKLINASELFKILIDPQVIQSFGSKHEDLKSNIVLSFLFYSDGLQKCLQIYSQFYINQKSQLFQLLQSHPYFSTFSSMILSYQKNFNSVLNCLQFYQDTQTNQKIKTQKDSKKSSIQNDNMTKNKDSISSLLQFYEQNDLVHRSQFSDQQIYINWLNKTLQSSKKGQQKSKKDVKVIEQLNLYRQTFDDFENPLKVLRILSQNTSFLSSSMNLTYFGYFKLLIKEMHAFESFQYSWNYPFYADFAISKNRIRGKKHVKQLLYIQTLATSGIHGRGRFFKEETSMKRNFMNFIDLSEEGKESNLIPIQTKRYFYGLRKEDNSIIMLKVPIHKGQQLLNTLREWMQDRFHLLDKVRSNQYEPQQFK